MLGLLHQEAKANPFLSLAVRVARYQRWQKFKHPLFRDRSAPTETKIGSGREL